jgi:ankyrin repeat protein
MNDDNKPVLFSPGVGKRGMTQLHYDAYCGNLEGLIWCLENGSDVNETDNYRGYAAIHWLADMAAVGGPRIEMLHALVAHGANSQTGDELAAELTKLGANPA